MEQMKPWTPKLRPYPHVQRNISKLVKKYTSQNFPNGRRRCSLEIPSTRNQQDRSRSFKKRFTQERRKPYNAQNRRKYKPYKDFDQPREWDQNKIIQSTFQGLSKYKDHKKNKANPQKPCTTPAYQPTIDWSTNQNFLKAAEEAVEDLQVKVINMEQEILLNPPNKETASEEQKVLEEAWGEYKSDWSDEENNSEEEDHDSSLFKAVPYEPGTTQPSMDTQEVPSLQEEATKMINEEGNKIYVKLLVEEADIQKTQEEEKVIGHFTIEKEENKQNEIKEQENLINEEIQKINLKKMKFSVKIFLFIAGIITMITSIILLYVFLNKVD